MRHTLYIIGTLLVSISLLSCEVIDREDRLTEVAIDVPDVPDPAEGMVLRGVLLEDFTGQNCPNCPAAAKVVEAMEERYGQLGITVVGVSLHSGDLGMRTRLYSEEAQHYFLLMGNPHMPQPAVRVNRTGDAVTGKSPVENEVPRMVADQVRVLTPVSVLGVSDSGEGDHTVTCTLTTSEETTPALIQMWLVEDNIKDFQKQDDGTTDRNYIHRGVFRKSLTPLDGQAVTLAAGTENQVSASFSPDSKWKMEDLRVVVIVSRPDGELLQVARFSLQK